MLKHRSDKHHFPLEVLARSNFPVNYRGDQKIWFSCTSKKRKIKELREFRVLSLPQRLSRVKAEKCLLDGATKLSLYPKHLTIMGTQKR